MVIEMLAMLRWLTNRKKAWFGFNCMRRLKTKGECCNATFWNEVMTCLMKQSQKCCPLHKVLVQVTQEIEANTRLDCYLNILMSSATVTWSGTRNLVLSNRGRFFSPEKRSTIIGILFGWSSLTMSASLTRWPVLLSNRPKKTQLKQDNYDLLKSCGSP